MKKILIVATLTFMAFTVSAQVGPFGRLADRTFVELGDTYEEVQKRLEINSVKYSESQSFDTSWRFIDLSWKLYDINGGLNLGFYDGVLAVMWFRDWGLPPGEDPDAKVEAVFGKYLPQIMDGLGHNPTGLSGRGFISGRSAKWEYGDRNINFSVWKDPIKSDVLPKSMADIEYQVNLDIMIGYKEYP